MEIPKLEYLDVRKMKLSEIKELHYVHDRFIIEMIDGKFYLYEKNLTELPRVDWVKETNFLTIHW